MSRSEDQGIKFPSKGGDPLIRVQEGVQGITSIGTELDPLISDPPVWCRHTLRVMGARELVRRRYEAGWPVEECRAPRDWTTACTTCLLAPGEKAMR